MKAIYLDCISGISGDMTLGALIDMGADSSYIVDHLRKLPVDPFEIKIHKIIKLGINATKLEINFPLSSENSEHIHSHEYSHEHGHNHSHDQVHEHGHNHSHDQVHEHGHNHSHDQVHEHGHNHSRDQVHEHGHNHSHDQVHEHGHNHSHDHVHEHNHSHSHDHVHMHGHSHSHEHGHDHVHRSAAMILEMIEQSDLPPRVKERSLAIFKEIAIAEGKIHGVDPSDVHFHEVGAMDSIIDIIGVCLALESLGIDDIYASPVPTGSGKKWMAHGLYPIPAPATMELLRGIPLAELNVKGELTTPTGAGILRALVKEFILPGGFTVEEIGYGAGEKDFDHPNVLRVMLITASDLKKKH
ncbi:LarC family nickel insertion protein [Neobacillus cucumis]|uniref:LarC family nickel insertion protein n=1 Tax=Neobacillus cucumis TaxID=1740721 RepID=UPI00203C4A4E|nr:nickel insertion protein [Neobacillus cucumis]